MSAPRPITRLSCASRTGSTRSSETRTRWKRIVGQAKNWIYPKIGATKLRDFTATDADNFFKELGQVLSKRTLVMIKSTLRRSIRRAQVHNLIARNVVELIDLPSGQPGRPSRAMTQAQASKVLKAAGGQATGFVKVVRASKGRDGVSHAATETGELACGNKPHPDATVTEVSDRTQRRDVPFVPLATRPRRQRRSQRQARGAVRHLDHPRPAPRRAPQAHLGSRRPQ